MSRVVYFDCASGASGDMLLGAVVDLGLPVDELRAELARLPLSGYALEASRVSRSASTTTITTTISISTSCSTAAGAFTSTIP